MPEKADTVRAEFIYELPREHWENPEKIRGARVWLPNGQSAWFCRIDDWEERPFKSLGA